MLPARWAISFVLLIFTQLIISILSFFGAENKLAIEKNLILLPELFGIM